MPLPIFIKTAWRQENPVGLQHPEGKHAIRDVAFVKRHAKVHADFDGQNTAGTGTKWDASSDRAALSLAGRVVVRCHGTH